MYAACWTMGGFPLFPLLIFALLLFLLYRLFRKENVNRSLDTLNEAFAKGEVSKGAYRAIKHEIT